MNRFYLVVTGFIQKQLNIQLEPSRAVRADALAQGQQKYEYKHKSHRGPHPQSFGPKFEFGSSYEGFITDIIANAFLKVNEHRLW